MVDWDVEGTMALRRGEAMLNESGEIELDSNRTKERREKTSPHKL